MRGEPPGVYSWPATAPKPPFLACIKGTKTFRARCGKEYEVNAYVFEDAVHAVEHYAHGATLRACPECVAAALPEIESLKASYKSKV